MFAMIWHVSLGLCYWPLPGTGCWGRWTFWSDSACSLLYAKKEVMLLIWWVHSKLYYTGKSQNLKAWQYGYHEKAFFKWFQQQLAGKIKTGWSDWVCKYFISVCCDECSGLDFLGFFQVMNMAVGIYRQFWERVNSVWLNILISFLKKEDSLDVDFYHLVRYI